MSRDLLRLGNETAMRLYGKKLIIVCNHPARIGGHRHCGSGDMLLIYHMTSRDHVFKGLCDFKGESFS